MMQFDLSPLRIIRMFSYIKHVYPKSQFFVQDQELVPYLIALHALSGCDTVPMLFGIGKRKALKAVEKTPLKEIGDISSSMDSVIKEGKQFIAKCYGQVLKPSSHNRQSIWVSKTDGVRSAKPPLLRS